MEQSMAYFGFPTGYSSDTHVHDSAICLSVLADVVSTCIVDSRQTLSEMMADLKGTQCLSLLTTAACNCAEQCHMNLVLVLCVVAICTS